MKGLESRLAICMATMKPEAGDLASWTGRAVEPYPEVEIRLNTVEDNLGVVRSYQRLYEHSRAEVLLFLHDDVICRERGWNERLLREFKDPSVGVVGFGGALWHGIPDLYKVPYLLTDLRRGDYLSNVDDAEQHGQRFAGENDVAVLDGFALGVRRSFLDRIGGLHKLVDGKIDFIGYDYAICALARRMGYRIRVVGVRCHHRGGGTSVGIKTDRQAEYDYSHRWFYEEFRDVMPFRVRPTWTSK